MQRNSMLPHDSSEPMPEDEGMWNSQSATSPFVSDREIGGLQGLEPTRYGDWEKQGRCIDF